MVDNTKKNKKQKPTQKEIDNAEEQIIENRKIVDYDTKEFTVELLNQKFESNEIFIPYYQRKYTWEPPRKSKFIESLILGLPIPFMFFVDTLEGNLEVIDGSQRLRTINEFLTKDFHLKDLEKLNKLNDFTYQDLPLSQQRKLKNRSLRLIVLSDKADEEVRKDLFRRINTGNDELRETEIRKGAYSGPFFDFVQECTENQKFRKLCPINEKKAERGEAEELVLRFFAYSEEYMNFKHSVKDFLDDYLKRKNKGFDKKRGLTEFNNMLNFVEKHFKTGFARQANHKTTPRMRFEAIAIGVNLALKDNPNLVPKNLDWLYSEQFKIETTTHASNSLQRLKNRIEFVRNSLLQSAV